MRRYLLDTNICIFYMKGKFHLNEKIDDKMKRYCFISEITIAELLYGATCSNRKDNYLGLALYLLAILPDLLP